MVKKETNSFAVSKPILNKSKGRGLTAEKKAILKSVVGAASSPDFDLNKMRDYYKYGIS